MVSFNFGPFVMPLSDSNSVCALIFASALFIILSYNILYDALNESLGLGKPSFGILTPVKLVVMLLFSILCETSTIQYAPSNSGTFFNWKYIVGCIITSPIISTEQLYDLVLYMSYSCVSTCVIPDPDSDLAVFSMARLLSNVDLNCD